MVTCNALTLLQSSISCYQTGSRWSCLRTPLIQEIYIISNRSATSYNHSLMCPSHHNLAESMCDACSKGALLSLSCVWELGGSKTFSLLVEWLSRKTKSNRSTRARITNQGAIRVARRASSTGDQSSLWRKGTFGFNVGPENRCLLIKSVGVKYMSMCIRVWPGENSRVWQLARVTQGSYAIQASFLQRIHPHSLAELWVCRRSVQGRDRKPLGF